ncbi:phage tail family protein [Alkalihalophilus lindianensis]|uniref:Phage tail family protein n=1 Tax=Alkalihalophilus lindianensis TaxID=1630542 RepID=A0ABU3X7E9_9BACI|nr:distal tail protein Dit [Alkalihalophilus lindianensis]MDV2683799.1 phage tail family protein [Alkalihalophilus lindianensis]MDV2683865.1 phage tail family protein [Alkalihalophilus lindianensis]
MPFFNGINLREWVAVGEKSRSLAPPIENKLIEVPGRHGSYNFGHELGVRQISIPVNLLGDTREEMMEKAKDFAGVLITNEAKSLWFPDEPDVFYYAKLSGQTDMEEFVRSGKTTLIFICSDPFRYDMEETTEQFDDDQLTIMYNGTAEAKPIFKATIKEPSTHLSITNQEGKSISLGFPVSMEQEAVVRKELVFHDTMTSTSSWQTADRVDNGYVAGTMAADYHGFYPESFGDPIQPHKWQGPSLKKAIGTPLQDFEIDINIENMNVGFETGMVEIYLLDANNNTVGKIGLEDIWRGTEQMMAKSQLGGMNGFWAFQEFPSVGNEKGWNNFNGLLRIARIGRRWTMYVTKYSPTGIHRVRRWFGYTDFDERYTVPITQIQVATRSWPNRLPTQMKVKEIKGYRINEPQSELEVPYILLPGDQIEINTETSGLLLNGEPMIDLYDLSTEFFSLTQGLNQLELDPKGISDAKAKYRRRWY